MPGRWPPRGLLVSTATAPDAGVASASVDHPISSSRADPSPDTSPSPHEEAASDDASGSPRVGGFGPWPHSNVRSFLRLSFASCTVHTSQKYHRTTWMSISQSERLGLPTICQPPFVEFLPHLYDPLTEHRHQDAQQTVPNNAQRLAMPMAFGAQSRIHLAEVRITLHSDARPMI